MFNDYILNNCYNTLHYKNIIKNHLELINIYSKLPLLKFFNKQNRKRVNKMKLSNQQIEVIALEIKEQAEESRKAEIKKLSNDNAIIEATKELFDFYSLKLPKFFRDKMREVTFDSIKSDLIYLHVSKMNVLSIQKIKNVIILNTIYLDFDNMRDLIKFILPLVIKYKESE